MKRKQPLFVRVTMNEGVPQTAAAGPTVRQMLGGSATAPSATLPPRPITWMIACFGNVANVFMNTNINYIVLAVLRQQQLSKCIPIL